MEIILALVVAAAVIFFGALISIGNERQRKAIDSLREQAELWAIQDLRIKRELLAREVRVDDPLAWLNKVVNRVCALDLSLQIIESFSEPQTLICKSENLEARILLSPFSPKDIKRMKREKRSRLSQFGKNNPLPSLSRTTNAYEFSVLNAGVLFDLELQLAWKGLTGSNIDPFERLWMYMD
jgi:hypothetical protein